MTIFRPHIMLCMGIVFLLAGTGCTGLDWAGQQKHRNPNLPPAEAEIDSMTVFPQDGGHARDTNNDGLGDVLRIGIYLYSRKTQQSTFGDGTLVIRMLQFRPTTTQPNKVDEIYRWELTRQFVEQADEDVLVRVTTGRQYRLGLIWPGKSFSGEAVLQVEFHSVNGSVVSSQEKVVNLTPLTRKSGGRGMGTGYVHERPMVVEITTQPTP